MNRVILDHYTPARYRWLAHLRYSPLRSTMRRGTIVGFQCMRLGWTQWVYGSVEPTVLLGEALTSAGLEKLIEWQAIYGAKHENR